jgi:membrane glycosyltransferase
MNNLDTPSRILTEENEETDTLPRQPPEIRIYHISRWQVTLFIAALTSVIRVYVQNVLCCAALYCVELCYVVLCCVVLCCVELCCAALCYVVLCCACAADRVAGRRDS